MSCVGDDVLVVSVYVRRACEPIGFLTRIPTQSPLPPPLLPLPPLPPPALRASTLSEFGTHQLEFWGLSQRTGNATYARLAEATIALLHSRWPRQVRRRGGRGGRGT